MQKFTPQGGKSVWSKKNTDRIEPLTDAGRMKSFGPAEAEKVKAGWRLVKAYDLSADMQATDDFLEALEKRKKP